jgi:formylglycine-generating enzyme
MPPRRTVLAAGWVFVAACSRASDPPRDAAPAASASAGAPSALAFAGPSAIPARDEVSAAPPAPEAPDASAPAPEDDPMAFHFESREELLALFSIRRPPRRDSNADVFLEKTFGPGSPSRTNQGNKALAHHLVSRRQCLDDLAGVVLQTDEQRARCGGAENMVPIYRHGKMEKAQACIDVFEFPNKACELPFVWISPVQAKIVCELQGKRLCSQEEWILACRGDPEGGKDRVYAYGDDLDLDLCNTAKPGAKWSAGCDPDSAVTAWKTCSTNTEPSGSFPRCRSRFGVFDQHGNVAEIMTRRDVEDGKLYSQLKGSAFFYVDVARRPDERGAPDRETYTDVCAQDPRWHVEPIGEAWHVNYHLGFRCCKTVR